MEQETARLKEFERELARFVEKHRLPADYAEKAAQYYLPLSDWLFDEIGRTHERTLVTGIYGAQGSGKSTLADLLLRIGALAGKSLICLSLDDFYLTRQERAQLAAEVSPLLATRGPPGTHDVDLALDTLNRLTTLAAGESMSIPRFDKASDDRVPESNFDTVVGPIDLVILEGWCLGCAQVTTEKLAAPINDLERYEDRDGIWRRFVNTSIGRYQPLFDCIDVMIMLRTGCFESVLHWRSVQEEKLRDSADPFSQGIMADEELARFVQFFERVSRDTEQQVRQMADVVITQDESHRVLTIDTKKGAGY